MDKYLFQYCPKLVIFSQDGKQVLLGKRTNEKDYDGSYSFFGGKTETTDATLLDGLRREKTEELGAGCRLRLAADYAIYNLLYTKQSGQRMVLPHFYAVYAGGNIQLNKTEYSEYIWIHTDKVALLEPKVENVAAVIERAKSFMNSMTGLALTEI